MPPDAALAICRFGHDAAAMILFGAFAYLAALVPRDLAIALGRRLHRLRVGLIVVAVGTTLAALPLDAAAIGDGWSDAVSPATITAVVEETSVGRAWLVQAVAAAMLAATLMAPAPAWQGLTALAAGLLLASLALSGHAVMHEGGLGVAHRVNDVVHVLSGGAWLGALAALAPILRALAEPSLRPDAVLALQRFSRAGHAAVALVVASGLVNTGLVLARWPADLSSPYRLMLAAKIVLVGVMTALALNNRYALVPLLKIQPDDVMPALQRGVAAQIALGLVAIALVAVFGLLDPT